MSYTNGLDKPDLYFDTILYTGDGATSRTITGLNFSTDLIWYKRRSVTGSHRLIDTVRGINKNLATDLTNAENTESTYVTAINSDGWDIGNNTDVNTNGNTMVVWNWRASDSSAVSNTDGSITSTVSANTTSGFSIVSYTGTGANATVGHGLGTAPAMIIFKNRSGAYNWPVLHHKLSGSGLYNLLLNSTNAEANYSSALFNSTSPTSSVFSIGTSNDLNASGNNIIAYCFAEKKGFSKFGTFVGNGQAYPNSPFIYLGFKPAFFMWKNTSSGLSSDNWNMVTAKAQQYNIQDAGYLQANSSSAETGFSGNQINFLSNGVKLNTNSGYHNLNGSTYIYMAFAESPFTTSTGIPTTAR